MIMEPVKAIEPITEKDEIQKFQELKEQVFEEYADYSLNKLYNFNELIDYYYSSASIQTDGYARIDYTSS